MKEINQEDFLKPSKKIIHIEDSSINKYELYFLCGKTSANINKGEEHFMLFYTNISSVKNTLCEKCKAAHDLIIFR